MRSAAISILHILAFALATVLSAFGQTTIPGPEVEVDRDKRGQTGFKFLSVSVDPRATAMGGAVTSLMKGESTSLFYNPATMAKMQSTFHVNASILEYIADINFNIVSAAYSPGGGKYGVFGLSLINVDYGEFFETIRADNEQGFIELGTYSPNALAVGVGYARSITDRFAVGGHVKYALEDLGSFAVARQDDGTRLDDGSFARFKGYSLNTVAFDFGILYNTGFRSLTIAMSTRNFSRELAYERENFELPLTFQIGASLDVVDLTQLDPNMHTFMIAVDAQRPRDFVEHLKIGAEYTFIDVLSLRGGWANAFVSGDESEEGFSFGAGVDYEIQGIGFGVDYAITDFGLFGKLNHFALQIAF